MPRFALLLAALFALLAPAPAQRPSVVQVDLSNFHIVPATIHLAAGQPVRMVFTNSSGSGHDFTAPAFFGRAVGVSGPVSGGQVELAGHSSSKVTLTPAPGTYKAKCSHFGHRLMGMSATILVD